MPQGQVKRTGNRSCSENSQLSVIYFFSPKREIGSVKIIQNRANLIYETAGAEKSGENFICDPYRFYASLHEYKTGNMSMSVPVLADEKTG